MSSFGSGLDPRFCSHPIAIDESDMAWTEDEAWYIRRCLTCGYAYDRTNLLIKLRSTIRERYRITSPWTSAELSAEADL